MTDLFRSVRLGVLGACAIAQLLAGCRTRNERLIVAVEYLRSRVTIILVLMAAFVVGGIAFSIILFWLPFDTEYSAGFTKDSWNKVRMGVSVEEVKSIIGEPVSTVRWEDQEKQTLNYTKPRSDNSNYVHYFIVVQGGKVLEKKKELCYD